MNTRPVHPLCLLLLLGALRASAVDLSHDPAGRLLSEQYTNGAAVAYGYDAAGNVTRVTMASPSNAAPAEVSVGVTTAPAVPAAGAAFTTTVTAANAGPGTAFGVTVTWNHAASLQVEAIGISQGWVTPSSMSAVFAFGAVPSGGVAVAEIVARHPAQGAATGTFSVASYAPDAAPANNAATQSLAVAAGADLVVTGASFPDPVCSGLPLTYFIAVSNAGPDAASAVVASNVVSGAFALNSVVMSQGSSASAGQTVALNFGPLAAGAAATAQVWLRPVQTNGWLTNTCTAAAAETDPDPAGNAVMLVNTVRVADAVVTTAADSGAGSLRAALSGAAAYVAFDIPGATPPSIHLLSPLPFLANRTVDGWSQWARTVELDGSGVTNAGADGVRIQDPGYVTLRGLTINRFPRDGVRAESVSVSLLNAAIEGCRIGTDVTGALPNFGNRSNGVTLVDVQVVTIGGATPDRGNVISGNGAAGVQLLTNAVDVVVEGNRIGTDLAGAAALSNGTHGVESRLTAATTDDVFVRGNLISGNGAHGVYIAGRNLVVHGNRIGTDLAGVAAIGNASGGVYVAATSVSIYNQIGGSGPGEGNLISGNGGCGVESWRAPLSNAYDWVAGNLIGTSAGGRSALPNQGDGVRLVNGYYAQVGDVASGGANVIAGNAGNGIAIVSGRYVNVWGNLIGIGADGATAVPNQGAGVSFVAASDCEIGGSFPDRRNVIGGNLGHGVALAARFSTTFATTSVEGNWIGLAGDGTLEAGNRGDGIAVLLGTGFRIAANAIAGNLGLGIDLNDDGVTANDGPGDPDSGPNGRMNFPVITNVASGAGQTVVQGTIVTASNTTSRVEFFASPSMDPSGYGEGAVYLGATTVALGTNGTTGFAATLPGNLAVGRYVTAVSTINGISSEFSAAVLYSPGDSDADGIPDDWENRWGLGLTAFSRTGDWDHDGVPDPGEYGADTCPTNAQDFLSIRSVGMSNEAAQVTFGSVTSRVYTLQRLSDLAGGDWAGVPGQAGVAGQPGGQTTVTDTNAARIRIYRILPSVP